MVENNLITRRSFLGKSSKAIFSSVGLINQGEFIIMSKNMIDYNAKGAIYVSDFQPA